MALPKNVKLVRDPPSIYDVSDHLWVSDHQSGLRKGKCRKKIVTLELNPKIKEQKLFKNVAPSPTFLLMKNEYQLLNRVKINFFP